MKHAKLTLYSIFGFDEGLDYEGEKDMKAQTNKQGLIWGGLLILLGLLWLADNFINLNA